MDVEFQATIDVGMELLVSVEASGDIHVDKNYGADIDGNRGAERSFLEDLRINVFDMRGNDITSKLYKKYRPELENLKETAMEQLNENYWGEL